MRILHVIIRLAEIDGGPPRGLVTLAQAQAEQGDEVTILPCTSLGGPPVIESGIYDRLTVLPPPSSSSLKLFDRGVREAAVSAVGQCPDIVHIHGTWRYHSVAASRAARKKDIPYIVRPAGNLGTVPRGSKAYLKWPYLRLVEKPVIKRAAAIHCCSVKELNEMQGLRLGPRAFVVPQPVEDALINVPDDPEVIHRVCPDLPDDVPVLLYLGRLAPIKQLPKLLEAFIRISKEFVGVHLVLAGPSKSDKLVSFMRDRIEKEELESRVHMPGMVRDIVKAAVFRRATVFVQPSIHENFGISTAEALLFGIPCVVNSGVALSDEIASAGAGIRFHEATDQLTAALRKMLSDGQFRQQCAAAARRLAEKFRPRDVAQQLRNEYTRILEG